MNLYVITNPHLDKWCVVVGARDAVQAVFISNRDFFNNFDTWHRLTPEQQHDIRVDTHKNQEAFVIDGEDL